MNTKQQKLNPVERTFCASGLLGLSSQRRVDRPKDYCLGQDLWLVLGTTAGMLGNHGSLAVIPSLANLA
ncbi:MAG: hypothetical protein AB8C95_06715 [Phycisphaeraceae bacterium]